MRKSMMLAQIFKMISQNPEFVESFCNDRKNLFHFACQKSILKNCSEKKFEFGFIDFLLDSNFNHLKAVNAVIESFDSN